LQLIESIYKDCNCWKTLKLYLYIFVFERIEIGFLGNIKNEERVPIDLCLGGTIREQRGKIIRKRVKNPTIYTTTFSL
tara:strand:- start:587 stop:820 length:234 start_codon:yes stop_codon:yes gene_type:complete